MNKLDGASDSPVRGLRVPFGLGADRQACRPTSAVRGGTYSCPDCASRLILHAGELKQIHFAHAVDPEYCDFINESETHLRAKHRVAQAINDHEPVRFLRNCASCGLEVSQPVPPGSHASVEYILPNRLRADVAMLDQRGEVRAVLEVRHLHACGADKVAADGVLPWAEFDATGLLRDDLHWKPLVDCLRPFRCPRCSHAQSRPFAGAGSLSVECPLPGAGTVLAVERCSACLFFLGLREGIYCGGHT